MNIVVTDATVLLAMPGVLTLLILGFRTVSDLLVRSIDRRKAIRSPFVRSFLLSSISLSRPAAVLHLVTTDSSADHTKIGHDRNLLQYSDILNGLRGGNLGSVIPLITLGAIMFLPYIREAGLLLLAGVLLTRPGVTATRGRISNILLGLGLILFSSGQLAAMTTGVSLPPLELSWLTSVPVVGLALAAAWLIGSSLAIHLFTLALLSQGFVPLPIAVVIMLMSNLGGAIAGATPSRKLGERALAIFPLQIALNIYVLGIGLALLPATRLVPFIAETPPAATAILLVTAAQAIAATPFRPISRFFQWTAARRVSRGEDTSRSDSENIDFVQFLPFHLPDAVAVNLSIMRTGLAQMGEAAAETVMVGMNACQLPEEIDNAGDRVVELDESLEYMQRAIADAVSQAIPVPSSKEQAADLQRHHQIAMELRAIGLDVTKLLRVLERSYTKQYRMHKDSSNELFDISARVLDFLRYNLDYLEGKLEYTDPELATSMEKLIDSARDRLRKRSRKTLEKKSRDYTRGELAFLQAVGYLEHIGDRCLRISEAISHLRR